MRVEVAQEAHIPLGIYLLQVRQHLLEHRLGLAVGVGAMALGALLGDGDDGGVAIDGGRGREDDVLAAVLAHHVEQAEGAVHVVLVVFQRLGAALADSLEAGEVDAGVKLVGVEDLLQAFLVADVHLVEGHALADDLLHAGKTFGRSVVEIVHHNGLVAGGGKFDESVASDEACTSGE